MNKTRKKVLIACLSILAAVVLAVGATFIVYFSTTLSAEDCIEYCREHSGRSANEFMVVGDGRYTYDYLYYVAINGDESKSQEVFVFKNKPLGKSDAFNRRVFVADNAGVGNSKVGVLQFHTREDDGKKDTAATLLLFASNASGVTYYETTFVKYGVEQTSKKEVVYTADGGWLSVITDLGYKEGVTTTIKKVDFYNAKGELVYTFYPQNETV